MVVFPAKKQTMNADHYTDVLDGYLLNFYNIHGCSVSIYNTASCYKAQKVRKWLIDHNIEIFSGQAKVQTSVQLETAGTS